MTSPVHYQRPHVPCINLFYVTPPESPRPPPPHTSRSELMSARREESQSNLRMWSNREEEKLKSFAATRIELVRKSRINEESNNIVKSQTSRRVVDKDRYYSSTPRPWTQYNANVPEVHAVPMYDGLRANKHKPIEETLPMKPCNVPHEKVPGRIPLHKLFINKALNERTGLDYPSDIVPLYSSFSGDKIFHPEYMKMLRSARIQREQEDKAKARALRAVGHVRTGPPRLLPNQPPPAPRNEGGTDREGAFTVPTAPLPPRAPMLQRPTTAAVVRAHIAKTGGVSSAGGESSYAMTDDMGSTPGVQGGVTTTSVAGHHNHYGGGGVSSQPSTPGSTGSGSIRRPHSAR